MTIDGATRLFGIIGDPIVQVRSAMVYTEQFARAGLNAVLVPLHVAPDDFDAVMPALLRIRNFDGVLVTAPFKRRALPFAQRLGATATVIGALNALRREADGSWSGDMFDGAGFVHGAQRKGERLAGRSVVLYGAGGAGSAIACALAQAQVRSIAIIDHDSGRAQLLASAVHAAFPACELSAPATAPLTFDMIVNATPVGMHAGDGLPAELGPLAAGTLVGDVIVSGQPTPMTQYAQRYGCRVINGTDMHSGQVGALMGFLAPGVTVATH